MPDIENASSSAGLVALAALLRSFVSQSDAQRVLSECYDEKLSLVRTCVRRQSVASEIIDTILKGDNGSAALDPLIYFLSLNSDEFRHHELKMESRLAVVSLSKTGAWLGQP